MIALVVLGVAIALASRTFVGRTAGFSLIAAPIVGWPVIVGLAAVSAFLFALRQARGRAKDATDERDAEIASIEGLSLATAAGLTFRAAAAQISGQGGVVDDAIGMNLRHWQVGLPPASGNEPVDAAFLAAMRSSASGAPVAPMLRGQLAELRRRRSEDRRMHMARLPVKLLFPLVFLILPGFVLLAVVPTVIGGLSRLQV